MQIPAFSHAGRFYKGNLHTHSALSDGFRTPEDVCRLYREAGYDFLALTDHFMKYFDWRIADTRPYRTETFTTLIGAELHAPETSFGDYWHILAVGLPLDFAPNKENETGAELAQRAISAGAFVAVAHPGFYHLTESDALSLGKVHAVEVFNATSIDHNDKPDGWYLLDILSAHKHRYFACATDDAHFHPDRADSCMGWVKVKAKSLNPESILETLKAGAFYSSTGPDLFDVKLTKNQTLTVRCSPVSRIFVTGKGWVSHDKHGNGITEARFSLKNWKSPYFRVTVRDQHGRRAWTHPIWLDAE